MQWHQVGFVRRRMTFIAATQDLIRVGEERFIPIMNGMHVNNDIISAASDAATGNAYFENWTASADYLSDSSRTFAHPAWPESFKFFRQ